MTLGGKLLC